MAELTLRDLRIAEEKNVRYRKQIVQLRDLLTQAQTKNELLRHGVKSAASVGEAHITRAAEQINILNGQLSKCRRIVSKFTDALNDTTKSTQLIVARPFVEQMIKRLTKAIGHEVQG